MPTLLVLWHSQTGGTRAMVEALCEGAAASPEVDVRPVHADEAAAADLLEADAVVFATPENLAAMSGRLKDWFDRSYYALLDRVNGRAYAVMVCAGSDGHNAVRQIERIATGLRLRRVAEPLVVNLGAQTPEAIRAPKSLPETERARCRELGETLAAGLALGIF
jgi:NAD(P)H-dependent FMN reductase